MRRERGAAPALLGDRSEEGTQCPHPTSEITTASPLCVYWGLSFQDVVPSPITDLPNGGFQGGGRAKAPAVRGVAEADKWGEPPPSLGIGATRQERGYCLTLRAPHPTQTRPKGCAPTCHSLICMQIDCGDSASSAQVQL